MKRFVVLFGPSAVGKMTVGTALAQQTGMKLFTNHMTIEMVRHVFPHGQTFRKLVMEFRRRMIEEAAHSDLPGLIFTYVWALELAVDRQEIDDYASLYTHQGGQAYFVELEASQKVRLERNVSPLRLAHKPSKRDLEWSRKDLMDRDHRFQLNSQGDFFYPERHLKIVNDNLPSDQAARQVANWLDSF